MIKAAAKRILPEPVQAAIKGALAYPPVYYTRMGGRIFRQWLLNSHVARFQADKAPLAPNYSAYEDLFRASSGNFEAVVGPFTGEFRWSLGRIYNGAFVSIDPELYYSMIRRHKPALIIEVGSGHSAHFAMDAVKRNGAGRIISIDPEPRRSLPRDVEHIRSRVEDAGLNVFSALRENDILFIDSSHTTGEAEYHCQTILPALAPGVIIHHHDVTYPYDIYHGDDRAVYGEPDVLLDFYSRNRGGYEIITCASYTRFENPELVNRLVKSYRWNPNRVPGSLWSRKTG